MRQTSKLLANPFDLTQEVLRQELHYSVITGKFSRLKSKGGKRAGDQVGSPDRHGYVRVGVNGQLYYAHILAWFYLFDKWLTSGLDHRDGCPSHNWFLNIRPATSTQNNCNRRTPKHNTSGFRGVIFNTVKNKWQARITINKKQKHLGYYDDPRLAGEAYETASIKYFGEFRYEDKHS